MISELPFRVDGRELAIRPLSALEAYDIAASANWMGLLPEAVQDEGREWLWARLSDPEDPLTMRALWRMVHGVAPEIYGVEWWSAVRLAAAHRSNWLVFEAWTVKRGFEPDAPWVTPRRMTAALMGWLIASCEKDVEWQQMEGQILGPPEYAAYLPEEKTPALSRGADITAFHQNAPHWATTTSTQAAEPAPGQVVQGAHQEAVSAPVPAPALDAPSVAPSAPAPAEGAPPWAGQPVMSMAEFQAQAQSWVAARRTRRDVEGEPPPPEST